MRRSSVLRSLGICRHEHSLTPKEITVTQCANVRLTGTQLRLLEEGLLSAFRAYPNLERLLLYELGMPLNQIVVVQTTYRDQMMQLIQWAESDGRTKELLLAAVKEKPGNRELRTAKEAILGTSDRDDLEKIVLSNPQIFSDGDAWRKAMIRAEWTVCRAEKPEGLPVGTAFLVAPNLVLTNYHVAHDQKYGDFSKHPETVRLRFGFRILADGTPEAGTLYALHKEWDVHKSPVDQLDYALVRLAKEAGKDVIGNFQQAPKRGWNKLQRTAARESQGLFILQHPLGDTLKMANGGVANQAGDWLDYAVDTEEGSSGSPVFNNKWELVALHSRSGKGAVNRGVAISAILDDLPAEVSRLLG
jgi:V8-like Glu-specific endopeptidase